MWRPLTLALSPEGRGNPVACRRANGKALAEAGTRGGSPKIMIEIATKIGTRLQAA